MHAADSAQGHSSSNRLINKVFANRYRILELISEGGMGTVFLAEHLLIGRHVALKRLHPELATNAKAGVRFQRQAHAASSTLHDHIVDVFDLGYDDEGAPFLVMEFLRGESLAETLAREVRLSPDRICNMMAQVLDALSAVHRKQIIHRDLKPDNIFLTERAGRSDFVKLLDFGVSKMDRKQADSFDLTRTGVMLGTPYYMSPEQARGTKELDHRVDLYAVGVILYEALTGSMPFDGENYHALLHAIVAGNAPSVKTLAPHVDGRLAAFVEKAIALSPRDRFRSAGEMLSAMEEFHDMSALAKHASSDRPGVAKTLSHSTSGPPPQITDDSPTLHDKRDSQPTSHKTGAFHPRVRTSRTYPGLKKSVGSRSHRMTPRKARPNEVRGTLVLGTLEYLQSRFGDDCMSILLSRLEEAEREPLQGIVLPIAWIPLSAYAAMLREVESLYGDQNPGLLHQIGSTAADEDLPMSHRRFLTRASPEQAVSQVPMIWDSYHRVGEVNVTQLDPGEWDVVTTGCEPSSEAHSKVMAGFYKRLLEVSGAAEVEATVVLSGPTQTVTKLSWKS